MAAADDAARRRPVTARSLSARIADAERRVGIKVGIAALTDDELVAAIEALRRIKAAQVDGTDPAREDLALGHRVAGLHAEGARKSPRLGSWQLNRY